MPATNALQIKQKANGNDGKKRVDFINNRRDQLDAPARSRNRVNELEV